MADTHTYVGPTTPWGLATGSPCRIVGKRAGGLMVRVSGRCFLVARTHVTPIAKAA